MNSHPIRTTIAIAGALLCLTSCTWHPTATRDSATTPTSATPTATAPDSHDDGSTPPTTPTDAASRCLGTSYRIVADHWCLYPATVTWITDTTILLTQPDRTDWTDPDAVATAYLTTSLTWDTTTDASSAAAIHRAAIYTLAGERTPDTSDPATARGQGEYLTAREHGATSTVTINRVYTEGNPPEPRQDDGTWARAIDYTRTTTYHDHTPATVRTGTTWVTLARTADGTWRVSQATPGPETTDQ